MVATIQQGARPGHACRQSSLTSIGRISGTRDSPPPGTGRDGTAASGPNATGPYRTRRYCRQPKASARRRAEWAECTCRVDAANHDRTVATSVSVLTMNRDNATLVTAGGFDGASPGDWGLVRDSTFVGISTNNVDRFGPCPYPGVNGAPPTFHRRSRSRHRPRKRGRADR